LFEHVSGKVFVTGGKIENDLSLTGGDFKGDLYLENIWVGGDFNFNTTKQCEKSVDCGGSIYVLGGKIDGQVNFEGAHLASSLFLENTTVGNAILLRATSGLKDDLCCKINGRVWLLGVNAGGDLDLSGVCIGGDVILQNANISQDLRASTLSGFSSEIQGDVVLTGAIIRGNVEFKGSCLGGDLNADRASIGGGFQVTFDLDSKHNFRVVSPVVKGSIHADAATIGKRVLLVALTAGKQVVQLDDALSVSRVSFAGAQINGEFSLYSEQFMLEILKDKQAEFGAPEIEPSTQRASLAQSNLEITVIHGNLHLNRAQVLGGVVLDGAKIEGELDLRDATVKAHISCTAIPRNQNQWERASVYRAAFEALDMTGDVNLTGLNISGTGDSTQNGDLIARDARIRGRVELYPFRQKCLEGETTNMAKIRGDLRLDAASISHLVISGENFNYADEARKPTPERTMYDWLKDTASEILAMIKLLFRGGRGEEESKFRLGLERAIIGRLQIIQPLPGPLDMSNLKVDRWDLGDDPSIYRKLLSASYPFKRSNYFAIENALRNEGLDEHADEVNVSMRRRDRKSTTSRLKIWFDTFLDLSIKYGTTSKRLAFIIVVLFGLSLWVFDNPNRVAYKTAPSQRGEGVEFVTSEYDYQQPGKADKRYLTRASTAQGQPVIDLPAAPWPRGSPKTGQ
jgi:hypothetical protein